MSFVDLEGKKDPVPSGPVGSGPIGQVPPTTGLGPSGGTSVISEFISSAKQPKVCLAHIAFKLATFVMYVIGRHLIDQYVMTFIFTIILSAFDFWTVKNITGRLLVGMRWWNDISDDGASHWYFESVSDESSIDAKDKSIFWGALYVWPLFWIILFIINFLSFSWDWLVLITMALTFAATNVVGYWKCSKDQKGKMAEWARNKAVSAVVGGWLS